MNGLDQVFAELGMKTNVTLAVLTVALLLSRVLPVIILSPAFGGEVVPTEIRMGIGVTLALVLFPLVSERITEIPFQPVPFVLLMLKELFIGICLAFIVNTVFDAAQIAGGLVDILSGMNMAQVYVPQLQQNTTIFSSLKLQLSVVLFLSLNGHHLVIEALADSLVSLPLDKYPSWPEGKWAFFDLQVRVFGDMLKVGLLLAGPAFIATFLTDLALGMINRVAPQVQVFFMSMSIKPLVAAVMVLVTMHVLVDKLSAEYSGMIALLRRAIRLLA